MPDIAGLRYVFVRERRGGPPGRDIDIRLQNGEPEILKQAALEVRRRWSNIPAFRGLATICSTPSRSSYCASTRKARR